MRDVPKPVQSSTGANDDRDELLRRIAELEAKLAEKESGEQPPKNSPKDELLRVAAETTRITAWESDPHSSDKPLIGVGLDDHEQRLAELQAGQVSQKSFMETGPTEIAIARERVFQRVLAELQAEQLSRDSLIDTCPTGIAITRDRVFLRMNAAYGRVLGYEVNELIGKSTRVLFRDEETWQAAGNALYPVHAASGAIATELELIRKDGTPIWVLHSGNIIDPQSRYGIFSVVDLSSQRALSKALTAAREAADSANRAKSGFLAAMSHEMRTPMHAVLGMLELLEHGSLESAQRESVRTIHGQAHELLRLIDEILDFSKIEAGQLVICAEPISLVYLIEQSRLVYQELATQKKLALNVNIDAALAPAHRGDARRIRQIVDNLLSNAIKFTDSGGIHLDLQSVRRDDEREEIRIVVRDTGIGIAAEDQEKLFQPFVQVDSRSTRRFGGTGLGLSICKRLADAMAGEVRMQSAPGEGTRMILCLGLPVLGEEELPIQGPNRIAHDWLPVNLYLPEHAHSGHEPILIAEDHPVNLRLIQRQLKLLGYRSETAGDGAEALDKWRRNRYSMLITDCHMPTMDGYQLAQAIRGVEGERDLDTPMPIIACTANALPEDAQRCLAAGMSDYIAKPVSLGTLQAKLAKWLPPSCSTQSAPANTTVNSVAPLKGAAAGIAASPAAQASPLDPSALLDFSGGNADDEREILEQFRQSNRKDSALLFNALDQREQNTVLHASHRIKGASRAIGATPLADVCERIEKAARAGDWEDILGAREALQEQTERLLEHIKTRIPAAEKDK